MRHFFKRTDLRSSLKKHRPTTGLVFWTGKALRQLKMIEGSRFILSVFLRSRKSRDPRPSLPALMLDRVHRKRSIQNRSTATFWTFASIPDPSE